MVFSFRFIFLYLKEAGTKPTSEMKKACEILKNEISQALIF
jgi:hypothetical protein